MEGLGYKARAIRREPGGVIMVIWRGSFVAPKGKSLYNMVGDQWLPWMTVVCTALAYEAYVLIGIGL